MFFFEKKNQKTFATWRTWPGWRTRQGAKVFCFFSSEKKAFSSAYLVAARRVAVIHVHASFQHHVA
jgi:hypothetical protein